MLTSLLRGDWSSYLFQIFVRLLVVFTALPFHEFAHGWMARRLGDHTAESLGRLDLNPLHHFDPIGTTMLLLTGYGWAKPVPINPLYFKNRKTGMAITALAGPVSNLLLAWVLLIVYKALVLLPYNTFTYTLLLMVQIMVSTNVSLAVFNLLPCPPLDGAKIFGALLPDQIYWTVMRYEQMIMYVLFALIMFTPILDRPLSLLTGLMYRLLDFLTGFMDLFLRLLY